jgi:Ca-activated chloride channel family protein
VEEREEAFDRYDDALLTGDSAFLLDRERPDIFTASLGNLRPGETAEVVIKYVAELPPEGEGWRLRIPTTISPRYVPEHRRKFEDLAEADRIQPDYAEEVPYELSLRVEANLFSPIRSVESPSHTIRTQVDGSRVVVELAGEDRRMDRDFVLKLIPQDPSQPVGRLVRGEDGEHYGYVALRPDLPRLEEPIEAVFVLDCSGSMEGTSLRDAKKVLRQALEALKPGDRFNIVFFGSFFNVLFSESQPADEERVASACRELEEYGNLGGTEILEPLRWVLGKEAGELPRNVFLITDGQVSNEGEVIALAAQHRPTTRIFTFGMGAGCSGSLVSGVARASGGACEFAFTGEELKEKVLRQLRRARFAGLRDLSVTWEGLEEAEPAPSRTPPLYPGDVWAWIVRGKARGRVRCRIQGRCAGNPWSCDLELAEADGAASEVLPKLWARRRIRELEEEGLGAAGSRQERRREERIRRQLAELGRRYGLLSSATSFVGVLERAAEEKDGRPLELRRIPTLLTRGWGGRRAMRSAPMCRVSLRIDDEVIECGRFVRAEAKSAQPIKRLDFLKGTIQHQMPEGCWRLGLWIELITRMSSEELAALAEQIHHPRRREILATLIVLVLAEEREWIPESWEPSLAKARQWLEEQVRDLAPPQGVGDWFQWVRDALRRGR